MEKPLDKIDRLITLAGKLPDGWVVPSDLIYEMIEALKDAEEALRFIVSRDAGRPCIGDIDMPARARNILYRIGFSPSDSIGELFGLTRDDLLKARNCGEVTADQILQIRNKYLSNTLEYEPVQTQ